MSVKFLYNLIEATNITTVEEVGVLQAANISMAINAGSDCLFTLYEGSCQKEEAREVVSLPLGACQLDGSGGSYKADPWDPADCYDCALDISAYPHCTVYLKHYASKDCSGDAQYLYGGSGECIGYGPPPTMRIGTLAHTGRSLCSESLLHAGWDCVDDVMWAKSTGIYEHPEWYDGLNASSSTEHFHSYVSQLPLCSSQQGPPCATHKCDPPCYQSKSTCSLSVDGGEKIEGYYGCYYTDDSISFGGLLNVCTPDGHGGANIFSSDPRHFEGDVCPSRSTTFSVSHYPDPFCAGEADHGFSAFMDGDCMGCCNEDASNCNSYCKGYVNPFMCHHVSPDSECAGQLRWAMTEGISNHPDWYAGLTADSSIFDFQRYLSSLPTCADDAQPPCYGASDRCPIPCE